MNLTIIVSVAVSALGVIVSCLLSYITARKEVNKLKLSLAHADKETVCKTFEELQQSVRMFLCSLLEFTATGLCKPSANT